MVTSNLSMITNVQNIYINYTREGIIMERKAIKLQAKHMVKEHYTALLKLFLLYLLLRIVVILAPVLSEIGISVLHIPFSTVTWSVLLDLLTLPFMLWIYSRLLCIAGKPVQPCGAFGWFRWNKFRKVLAVGLPLVLLSHVQDFYQRIHSFSVGRSIEENSAVYDAATLSSNGWSMEDLASLQPSALPSAPEPNATLTTVIGLICVVITLLALLFSFFAYYTLVLKGESSVKEIYKTAFSSCKSFFGKYIVMGLSFIPWYIAPLIVFALIAVSPLLKYASQYDPFVLLNQLGLVMMYGLGFYFWPYSSLAFSLFASHSIARK